MSKIVIGIHGLNNKPPAKVLYEKGWKKALLEGLSKNENISRDNISFEGVYWADKRNSKPDSRGEIYRPARKNSLKGYDEGFVEEVVQKTESFGGGIIDWFKDKLNIDKAANAILKKKLADLYEYYNNEDNYIDLTSRLRDKLEEHADKKILLVAHSMGSIIAYDALRMMGRENNNVTIDHFITIGSPLGLPYVMMKIRDRHHAARTPTIVKRWTNFADRRDPVALDEHLKDDFKANVAGTRVEDNLVLNDWRVKKGTDIFHKSYGYLRTPEFSKALAEFI